MARARGESFPCPTCGTDVPAKARSCPECGADDETGWSEDTLYDGLDLPEPLDEPAEAPRDAKRLGIRIVAIVLLALIAILFLARAW